MKKPFKIKNSRLNIIKSSIEIIHWNKGPSLLQNKVDHIKHLIQLHKPHIFSISEANYDISNKIFNLGLDDYNIEYTDQCNNYNISRQIILIDRRLSYSRRNDLEKINDCNIWLQLKLKRQKHILFASGIFQRREGIKIKIEIFINQSLNN